MLRRLFAGFCLAACLALSIVGCGSGSSTSSSPSSGSTAAQEATTSTSSAEATTQPGTGTQSPGRAQGGSAQGQQGAAKPQPSIAAEEAAPGDHSIQEYGSEAQGSEKEEVLAAMHTFFTAMGSRDYAKVCSGLTASNREQLAQFVKHSPQAAKGCAASLSGLLNPAAAAEAKKASQATIGKLRIGKGTAFVLFRPPGGVLSYFVMKEEGGAWKAISLAPGTPLNPTAAP